MSESEEAYLRSIFESLSLSLSEAKKWEERRRVCVEATCGGEETIKRGYVDDEDVDCRHVGGRD